MDKFKVIISETRKRNKETIKKIVADYEEKAYNELKQHLEKNPFMAEVQVISVPIKYFDLVNGTVKIRDLCELPLETVKGDMDVAELCYEKFCNIENRPEENQEIATLLYEAFKEAGFETVISYFDEPYGFYPLIADDKIIEEILQHYEGKEEEKENDEKTT